MASPAPPAENKKTKAGIKVGLKIAKAGGKIGLGAVKMGLTAGGVPAGAEICGLVENVGGAVGRMVEESNVVDNLVDKGVDKVAAMNVARNEGKEPKPVKPKKVLSQEELEKQEKKKQLFKKGAKVAKFGSKIGFGALKVGLAASGMGTDLVDGIEGVVDISADLADGLEQACEIVDQVVGVAEDITDTVDEVRSTKPTEDIPISPSSPSDAKKQQFLKKGSKVANRIWSAKIGFGAVKGGLAAGGMGTDLVDGIGGVADISADLADGLGQGCEIVDRAVGVAGDITGNIEKVRSIKPTGDIPISLSSPSDAKKQKQLFKKGAKVTKFGFGAVKGGLAVGEMGTDLVDGIGGVADISADLADGLGQGCEIVDRTVGVAGDITGNIEKVRSIKPTGDIPISLSSPSDAKKQKQLFKKGAKVTKFGLGAVKGGLAVGEMGTDLVDGIGGVADISANLADGLGQGCEIVDRTVGVAGDITGNIEKVRSIKPTGDIPISLSSPSDAKKQKQLFKKGAKVTKFGLGAVKGGLAVGGMGTDLVDGIGGVADISADLADGLGQGCEIVDRTVGVAGDITGNIEKVRSIKPTGDIPISLSSPSDAKKQKQLFKKGAKVTKFGLGAVKGGLAVGGMGTDLVDGIGGVADISADLADGLGQGCEIVDRAVGVAGDITGNIEKVRSIEPTVDTPISLSIPSDAKKQKQLFKKGAKVTKFGLGAVKGGLAASGMETDLVDGIGGVANISADLADGLGQGCEIVDRAAGVAGDITGNIEKVRSIRPTGDIPISLSSPSDAKKQKQLFKKGAKVTKFGFGAVKGGLAVGEMGTDLVDGIGGVADISADLADGLGQGCEIVDRAVGVAGDITGNIEKVRSIEPTVDTPISLSIPSDAKKQKQLFKKGAKVTKFGLGAVKGGLAASGMETDLVDGIGGVADISADLADGLGQGCEIVDRAVGVAGNITGNIEKVRSIEPTEDTPISLSIPSDAKKQKQLFKKGAKVTKFGLGAVKGGLAASGMGTDLVDGIGGVADISADLADGLGQGCEIVDRAAGVAGDITGNIEKVRSIRPTGDIPISLSSPSDAKKQKQLFKKGAKVSKFGFGAVKGGLAAGGMGTDLVDGIGGVADISADLADGLGQGCEIVDRAAGVAGDITGNIEKVRSIKPTGDIPISLSSPSDAKKQKQLFKKGAKVTKFGLGAVKGGLAVGGMGTDLVDGIGGVADISADLADGLGQGCEIVDRAAGVAGDITGNIEKVRSIRPTGDIPISLSSPSDAKKQKQLFKKGAKVSKFGFGAVKGGLAAGGMGTDLVDGIGGVADISADLADGLGQGCEIVDRAAGVAGDITGNIEKVRSIKPTGDIPISLSSPMKKQRKKFGIFRKRAPKLGSVEKSAKIDFEDELDGACWEYSGFPKDAIESGIKKMPAGSDRN